MLENQASALSEPTIPGLSFARKPLMWYIFNDSQGQRGELDSVELAGEIRDMVNV